MDFSFLATCGSLHPVCFRILQVATCCELVQWGFPAFCSLSGALTAMTLSAFLFLSSNNHIQFHP